ncbi:MAG: hypothetical protein Q9159_005922 [Coniocarpon cinnabarinum]
MGRMRSNSPQPTTLRLSSPSSYAVSEPDFELVSDGPRNFLTSQIVDMRRLIRHPIVEIFSNADFTGRGQEYDIIFWLHAGERDTLNRDFLRIAVDLGLQDKSGAADSTISKELVTSWLSNLRCADPVSSVRPAKWLLVSDNADDLVLLTESWPREGHGSILITSQNELELMHRYVGACGTDLEVLSFDEAANLTGKMFQRLPYQHNSRSHEIVAAKMHCLPLAIVYMAGLCQLQGWPPDEFLRQYNEEMESRKLHQPYPLHSDGHLDILAPLWSLHRYEGGSKKVLFVLALLDSDNVREDI